LVGAHIWSANHDEAAFGCPAQFDPDREDANKLLSWGKATHFCLGAPLARLEVTTAVRVALQRLPNLRLVPGHELQRVPAFFLPNVIGGLEVAWDV
jgi:cytochrome P450